MKRIIGVVLGLVALVLTVSACGPSEGKSCTSVGKTVEQDDGTDLRCQTDEGETTPHWHVVN
jgi:ABC-type Fe3+-citrate transport system substrate-binding protein